MFPEDFEFSSAAVLPQKLCDHDYGNNSSLADVILYTVNVPVETAVNHGLVLTNECGQVQKIIYKPSKEECGENDSCT